MQSSPFSNYLLRPRPKYLSATYSRILSANENQDDSSSQTAASSDFDEPHRGLPPLKMYNGGLFPVLGEKKRKKFSIKFSHFMFSSQSLVKADIRHDIITWRHIFQ
jgi:hypothetical protein